MQFHRTLSTLTPDPDTVASYNAEREPLAERAEPLRPSGRSIPSAFTHIGRDRSPQQNNCQYPHLK